MKEIILRIYEEGMQRALLPPEAIVFGVLILAGVLLIQRLWLGPTLRSAEEKGQAGEGYRLVRVSCLTAEAVTLLWLPLFGALCLLTGIGWLAGNVWFRLAMLVLSLIWTVGFLIRLFGFLMEGLRLHRLAAGLHPAETPVREEALAFAKKLGIRQNIRVCRGYAVLSPFCFGVLRPVICLPERPYTHHEREVILYHELTHIRYHDIPARLGLNLITILLWFCGQERWWLSRQHFWDEAHCDVMVCQSGIVTPYAYARILSGEAGLLCGKAPEKAAALCFCEPPEGVTFVKRIQWVLFGRERGDGPARRFSARIAGAVLIPCLSAVLCGAGTLQLSEHFSFYAEGYDRQLAYRSLEVNVSDCLPIPEAPVPAGTVWRSAPLSVKAGQAVIIRGEAEAASEVDIGLIGPLGKRTYVRKSGSFCAVIPAERSGLSRIYAESPSGTGFVLRGVYGVLSFSGEEEAKAWEQAEQIGEIGCRLEAGEEWLSDPVVSRGNQAMTLVGCCDRADVSVIVGVVRPNGERFFWPYRGTFSCNLTFPDEGEYRLLVKNYQEDAGPVSVTGFYLTEEEGQ